MRDRCQICGEFDSENTTVIRGHDVCYDCVDMLVDNEVERRMERQADGDPCRDYQAEFRDEQIAAQQLKR